MERTLALIPLKNVLASDRKYTNLVALIIEQLEDFRDHKYKCNPELALHIITIIENIILKKDHIDKLQLAIDVFSQLFNIDNKEDIKSFSICIHFLLDHKSAKKISNTKYMGAYLKSFFLEKK
jgi:hypothetical protein